MGFVPFQMERWQSTYEHRVRYNLSESGVHPLTVGELLSFAGGPSDLLSVRLGYSQSNGTDELRARIASLYPGASGRSVVVTTGGAEANFVAFWELAGKRRPAADHAAQLHAGAGADRELRQRCKAVPSP